MMGRRRTNVEPIQDKAKRQTTFTKRRKGLFKKTEDYCANFDAHGAVIAFSKAGNLFAWGNPRVESVVGRYLDSTSISLNGEEEEGAGGKIVAVEPAEATEAERKIREAVDSGRWNELVGDLGLGELEELEAEVQRIRSIVAARAREVSAAGENIGGNGVSGANSTVTTSCQSVTVTQGHVDPRTSTMV